MNWLQVKDEVEALLQSAPQRGARAARAMKQVEDGLSELAQVGFSFEPQIKGLVEAMAAKAEVPPTRTLSVQESIETVTGKKQNPSMVVSGGSETFKDSANA